MIIDVHSHAWPFPGGFSEDFIRQASGARANTTVDLTVTYEAYRATAPADTRTVVFGGKAKLSGVWIDNAYVADYVAAHPDTLIGFLSVDPTQPGWQDDLRHSHETLGLRGVKLLPMYAGFKVCDPLLDPLWEYCDALGLPVLMHTGTTFVRQAPLDCTFPRLIEPVALSIRGSGSFSPTSAIRGRASASSRSASTPTSTPTSAPYITGLSNSTKASCSSRNTASGTRSSSAPIIPSPP